MSNKDYSNNQNVKDTMQDNDILQEIPDHLLTQLRNIFKQNWPYASQAYFFIDMIIKWKNIIDAVKVKFFAPNGIWKDGTFVAVISEWNYKIFFFTLNGSEEELIRALYLTKKINWNDGAYIIDTHEKLIQPLMTVLIPKLSLPIHHFLYSSNWWLDKEIALQYDIKCPTDVYIDILTPQMADVINSHWPEIHRFPGSPKFLKQIIERNEGLGIYTKETNELRSWITINEFGALTTLQTVEQFKRNGYASLLVKEITKRRAFHGLDSLAFILQENMASISLFSKLGFIKLNNLRCVKFDKIEKPLVN